MIVKCSECNCNYIRDVVPEMPTDKVIDDSTIEFQDENIKNFVMSTQRLQSHIRYPKFDQQNWIVRNLCQLAAKQQGRDIRLLDFGPGGGQMCNSARVCGVRDVIAYDPYYSSDIQDRFNAANFPGIYCISTAAAIVDDAPYDAVVFRQLVAGRISVRE